RREGDAAWSAFVPESSIWISDRLLPCVDFGEDGELLERRARLEDYIEARKRNGFLGGDWTKGGRPATPEELQSLAGEAAPGVPKGLVFCEVCGGWRGVCLDPNPIFKNKVMTVLCRCENDNLCARCGQPLDTYKLNANYFGEDGLIWHTPGFCGLNHRCHDLPPVN
ncbi:MAG TPA: hypothetical protein PLP83_12145, partial [Candidatus Aminicenantes bacterium]|nr:hypothetical protein [Candidatus Aminicenantes bacterium]